MCSKDQQRAVCVIRDYGEVPLNIAKSIDSTESIIEKKNMLKNHDKITARDYFCCPRCICNFTTDPRILAFYTSSA
jgi:hypothetical protein